LVICPHWFDALDSGIGSAVRNMSSNSRQDVIAFVRREGYRQPIGEADRFFTSERDGEIVGAVRLSRERGVLVLRGMRVRADMRRRGIGRRLLAQVVAAIGGETCYCIPYRWLISFYTEAGFSEVKPEDVPPLLAQRHAKYVRVGLDVVVMGRRSR
jgi:N-acetylglutamate synthase-like GNAT family acetyltransferase